MIKLNKIKCSFSKNVTQIEEKDKARYQTSVNNGVESTKGQTLILMLSLNKIKCSSSNIVPSVY